MADTTSSVALESTTAELAGKQPLEQTPGAFPETPSVTQEKEAEDPLAKENAPPKPEQTFSVNPIPAVGGLGGNPIHLDAGEKVPDHSTLTGHTLTSNVKLDKASYEKSDALPPVIPATLAQSPNAADSSAILTGLGPQTTNLIPESSLGMGKDVPPPIDPTPAISSVASTSTTNHLAGQVPLEPRGVPEVVQDSQKEAHVAPEASANPTAVAEKNQVETELRAKVPEEQPAAESSTAAGIVAAVTGGIAAAGAAAASAIVYANEKSKETTGADAIGALPQSVQNTINANTTAPTAQTTSATSDAAQTTASTVPAEVKHSQQEVHADPEASANPTAVVEKSQVEQELLKKVPESQATGAPAPTATAAVAGTAPAATTATIVSTSGAPQLADPVGGGLAPINLDEGLNASAASQAQTPATSRATELATNENSNYSRDVSPMTKPNTSTEPVVTTGVDSATVPSTSKPVGSPRPQTSGSTPGNKRNSLLDRFKGSSDSPKSPDTEEKRRSFFGKLKEKFSSNK